MREAAVFDVARVQIEPRRVLARRRHAVNEDEHSPLDGVAPLFVVADGVGSGALASWASRELVSRLHPALDRVDVDAHALHNAMLEADREIAGASRGGPRPLARRRSRCAPATGAYRAG